MIRRLQLGLVALLLLLLGVVAWYEFAGGRVPVGQVPLTSVSPGLLDPVKDDFNRSADRIRIVLLLSPT